MGQIDCPSLERSLEMAHCKKEPLYETALLFSYPVRLGPSPISHHLQREVGSNQVIDSVHLPKEKKQQSYPLSQLTLWA